MFKRTDGTFWVRLGQVWYQMNWDPDHCDEATPLFTGKYHKRGDEPRSYLQ